MKRIAVFFLLLMLSTSAHAAWTLKPSPTENLYAIDGAISTNTATLCVVGDSGAVYISNDYGTNWSSISSTAIGSTSLRGASIAGNSLWVAGESKTFVSTDWGGSWSEKSTGSLPVASLDISFADSNNGVVVGTMSDGRGRVSYTTDGGTNWTSSTPAIFNSPPYHPEAVHYNASAGTFWIAGSPGYIGKSTNGGQTWTQKGSGITSNLLQDIYFVDANNGFAVGSNQTFLYTTDGGNTWTSVSNTGYTNNIGVYALDANTVWIVGRHTVPNAGKILKLTKSDSVWSSSEELSVNSEIYRGAYFFDANNGWTVGVLPGTPDAGQNLRQHHSHRRLLIRSDRPAGLQPGSAKLQWKYYHYRHQFPDRKLDSGQSIFLRQRGHRQFSHSNLRERASSQSIHRSLRRRRFPNRDRYEH